MKKVLFFISLIFTLSLFGCSSVEKDYNKFHNACLKGDYATAEMYSTDLCIEETKNIEISVCMNAHDSIQLFWDSMGEESIIEQFEVQQPEVKTNGNTAYLSWIDTDESWTTVQLYKIERKWKVNKYFLGKPED